MNVVEFVTQIQLIGVTLQAYIGAYNNTAHPSAADAQAQFVQNCGPPPSKKRRLLFFFIRFFPKLFNESFF